MSSPSNFGELPHPERIDNRAAPAADLRKLPPEVDSGHGEKDSTVRPPPARPPCPVCQAPLGAADQTCPSCNTFVGLQAVRLPTPARLPDLPGYEVLEKLGEGGMGVVYKARQLHPGRIVAIKMILGGLHVGPEHVIRFLTEAEAVGRLEHPNIVRLYECGQHDGLPFFTLEYVPGGSLEKRIGGKPLPPRESAWIVEQLARGMAYVHGQEIVHRDLKPANVLLASGGRESPEEEETGDSRPRLAEVTPKITDFGLARHLEGGGLTPSNRAMGTPCYMSPEQARGKSKDVGPPADIYSLGAILYECLTGRPPFQGASAIDIIPQVISGEPLSPSSLAAGVPRDLDTICLKCLEKEPGRRYAGAIDLAEDLRRFQTGETIIARPVGALGRMVKWVKRRPLVAGLAASLVAALIAGTGISTAFAIQAERKAEDEAAASLRAQKEQKKAEEQTKEAEDARGLEKLARENAERLKKEAETAQQAAEKARRKAEEANDRLEHALYLAQIRLARREWLANNMRQVEQALDACPVKRRGWEWHYLKRLCHADLPSPVERTTFSGHEVVAFNRRGDLATADLFGKVVVWSEVKLGKDPFWWPKEFKFFDRFPALGEVDVKALALSLDGRYVAAVNRPLGRGFGPGRPQVKVWEILSGKDVTPAGLAFASVNSLAFHPDGNRLLVGGERGVLIFDLAQGRAVLSFNNHAGSVESVAYSSDGTRVVSGSADGSVRVWEAASGKEEYVFERQGRVMCVAFSPGGNLVAAAGTDGYVKIWETWSDRNRYSAFRLQVANLFVSGHSGPLTGLPMLAVPLLTPRPDPYLAQRHDGMVRSLAFSPDGAYLASASNDRTVKVFDVDKGQTRTYRGHTDIVVNVAFSPDAKVLASAGMAFEVKFWDPAQDQESRTLGHIARAGWEPTFSDQSKLAFSPDSKLVASTIDHKTVRVWEAATGKEVQVFQGHESTPIAVAFSADSRLIASGGGRIWDKNGEVLIWEVKTGKVVRKLAGHGGRVRSLAFSPDGRFLASGSEREQELFPLGKPVDRPKEKPGTVILWNAVTGQELFTLRGYSESVQGLAFSRDSKLLASASDGGVVKLHDTGTGQEILILSYAGSSVALSPDGSWLAVGSGSRGDGSTTIYETATGKIAFKLAGHFDKVAGVAFTPDGRLLASAGRDGTVRLWDLETRQEILSLSQPGSIESVVFSQDGQFLAAVGGYLAQPGRLWLWNASRVPEK